MTLISKVVFLFSLVGAYWNTLLLWVIALLCQREILANKYPCDYSLLQKVLGCIVTARRGVASSLCGVL